MSVRKPQNKDLKGHNKKIRKKSEEDLENDDDSLSENELVDEEFPEQKITDDLNSDEFDEYDHIVEKFEKGNTKRKIVNIFNRIGKPKFREYTKLDTVSVKVELKRLILLLDEFNIIVHFHNDYTDREKYRFITEEVFKEYAEYDKKNNHITFLYEDYHPEMAEDDDDEDF